MATELRPSIDILDALDDPNLFGAHVNLSPRQREPLEAISEGARTVALEWGRRSGKTLVLALAGLWHCLPRPELEALLLPGERRMVLCVATNVKQARQVIASAEVVIAGSPVLRPMVESRTDLELRFRHDLLFVAMPANAMGDRGRAASCVLLDEFAHHLEGEPDGPRSAERLLAAVVPSVSQFKGLGTVVIASTPSGDSNKFAAICDEIAEDRSPTSFHSHGATWEINPKITEADLAEERRLLGAEYFSQEFAANRLSGAGAFLAADSIAACATDGGDVEPTPELEFTLGIDPAMSSDTFGAVVLGVERRDPSRYVVAQVHGWQGERVESFEQARLREDELMERVLAVCRRYRIDQVATDTHKAKEIRSRLAEHGIELVEVGFTGSDRRDVFTKLRLVLDEARIDLGREPQLLQELRALRVKYTSAGQVVEIPRLAGKSHCDRAVALALALASRETPELGPVYGVYIPPAASSVAGSYARERGEVAGSSGGGFFGGSWSTPLDDPGWAAGCDDW